MSAFNHPSRPGSSPAAPAYVQERPGGPKSMSVVALPPYALGGAVTSTASDGTQTTASVAANAAVQILPANPNRRSFRVVNAGVNRATYGYGSAVAPGLGWPLAPADGAGDQGGSDEDMAPHTGAIWAVSAGGTTLVVVEG